MSAAGTAVDTGAIERARIVAATEAGHMMSLGDGIGVMDPLAGGQLASSVQLIRAAGELTRAVVLDLTAAGECLHGVNRALDDTIHDLHGVDRSGAAALGGR